MSTNWYEVHFGGAVIGYAAFHNTSDLWFNQILDEKELEQRQRGVETFRCPIDHAWHWVEVRDFPAVTIQPARHVVAACLRCRMLVLPPCDDWGSYEEDFTDAQKARCVNERPA
jgi:hypothetical protein